MVFTCSHEVWPEFKVTNRGQCFIVIKGDVIAEVIERNWAVIVDRDVDLVGEITARIVGPNGVCDSCCLKILWGTRDGACSGVEG